MTPDTNNKAIIKMIKLVFMQLFDAHKIIGVTNYYGRINHAFVRVCFLKSPTDQSADRINHAHSRMGLSAME